jgi:hypothetical protein
MVDNGKNNIFKLKIYLGLAQALSNSGDTIGSSMKVFAVGNMVLSIFL